MFSSPVLSLSLSLARARCVTVFAQKSFDVRREDTIILLAARSLFEFFCSPFCSSFVVRVQTKKKRGKKRKEDALLTVVLYTCNIVLLSSNIARSEGGIPVPRRRSTRDARARHRLRRSSLPKKSRRREYSWTSHPRVRDDGRDDERGIHLPRVFTQTVLYVRSPSPIENLSRESV